MSKRKTNQKGFTLVELLVVVVIIGILASVAIPNFVGAQDKAKNSGVQANAHTIQMGVEQYGVDNGGSYIAITAMNTAGGYLAGNAYPRTPWNGLQVADCTTITSTTIGKTLGTGTLATAPSAFLNFGCIEFQATGSTLDSYDLQGTGKKGQLAVLAADLANH